MRLRRSPVLVYVLLVLAVTWVVWVPRAAVHQGWLDLDLVVALGSAWTYGPAVAAVLAAVLTGGRPALRELGARVTRWRVGWEWYVAVFVLPLLWWLLTAGVGAVLGAGFGAFTELRVDVAELLVIFVLLSLTDGLGEEVGWRGWALPQLLRRRSAWDASLLLGILWAAWHLPLHWTDGSFLADMPVWVLFARLPATAVAFTWVFRHTRGSALIAVLLHGAHNVAGGLVPTGVVGALAGVAGHWIVALALLVLAGRELDRWPRTPARRASRERPAEEVSPTPA